MQLSSRGVDKESIEDALEAYADDRWFVDCTREDAGSVFWLRC